jgi:hypothetical protein
MLRRRITVAGLAAIAVSQSWFAAGTVACAEPGALPGAEVPDQIMERILQRQASIPTFYFAWTTTTFVQKDSPDLPLDAEASPPAEDKEVRNVYTMLVEDDKVRFSQDGFAWHSSRGEFVPFEYHGAYVGGVHRDLRGDSGVVRPQSDILGNPKYRPPLLAYRLLDPAVGPARGGGLSLVGEAEHEGHPCAVIEAARFEGTSVYRWFLAQDMDYFVVRAEIEFSSTGSVLAIDLGYEPDAEVGWRLASWTTGGVSLPTASKVTDAWFNRDVPADAFDVYFPPGTMVSDSFLDTEYVVGPEGEHSVVEEPGAPDTMEDFAARVERQTAAARPAPAPKPAPPTVAPPAPGGFPIWVYVAGAAIVLIIAVSVWLRCKRRI